MKALLLTTDIYAKIYNEFYSSLHKQLGSMDVRRLGENEQSNLKKYFSENIDTSKLDRVILHLDFGVLKPQLRFFKTLNNLVFYNTDAHSGRERSDDGVTQRIDFFKKISWAKIIVSNYRAMQKFQDAGLDAWCVPEGFNSSVFTNTQKTREIELAFIENASLPTPPAVAAFKKELLRYYPKTHLEANVMSTGQGSQLGKVQMAVCADIGRREYSGKVFQAMASGCLVMSYDQSGEEAFHLSLKDMENIVIFDSFDMLRERIEYFRKRPAKMAQIAQKGYELAIEHHQEVNLGRQAGNYIVAGVRNRDDYGLGISAFGFRF